MTSERFLNTYHNSSTPPPADVPPELVPMTDDEERRALEALIGLPAPSFIDSPPENE